MLGDSCPLELHGGGDSWTIRSVFTYIDLFAGCGGLSLGLRRAGGRHVLAVEKSPMASETYYRNLISDSEEGWARHKASSLEAQVEAQLVVGPVDSLLNRPDILSRLRDLKVDLVAGGPPCQGFSLAGRRNHDDPRNRLAWEFLDFVKLVRPKYVLIENVVGMDTKFRNGAHTSPFKNLKAALRELGYEPHGLLLNSMHFGAPQSRPRMMIIGKRVGGESVADSVSDDGLWKSRFLDELEAGALPPLRPIPTVTSTSAPNLGEAISDLGDPSFAPLRASVHASYESQMGTASLWPPLKEKSSRHNLALRAHRESTKQLFRLLQILTKLEALTFARHARQHEFSLETVQALRTKLPDEAFPVKSPDGVLEFESAGQLIDFAKEHLTRKHSQTVLDWDKPSRTVVTIPDDYVHPKEPRTFSVRELARLQGFPDSFVFHGKVTTGGTSRRADVPQYTQVGNAVSPFVSLALGRMVDRALRMEMHS
jgi:DNA (cytosine-5)-methyltransferase 1